MPAPTKAKNDLMKAMEDAQSALLVDERIRKITHLRVRQAIARHPDLVALLEPVRAEMLDTDKSLSSARASLRDAIGQARKAKIK